MFYKFTKATGILFMTLGSVIIFTSFIFPLLVPKATSDAISSIDFLSIFSTISKFIVFIVIFFNGLKFLALGQAIYLFADIAEDTFESNRYLKYIAKRISVSEKF